MSVYGLVGTVLENNWLGVGGVAVVRTFGSGSLTDHLCSLTYQMLSSSSLLSAGFQC